MKILSENIPQEMKMYNNWAVWRYEDAGSGKPRKIPYCISGGSGKSNDAETWGTYEEAMTAYNTGGYDGIMFALENSPYIGFDIDDAIDPTTGEMLADAENAFEIAQSYTELSPGGKGLHIILKGKLPDGRRRKGCFEMYGHGSPRFFTMTGQVMANSTTIRDDQNIINILHKQFISAQSEKASTIGRELYPTQEVDDKEILRRANSYHSAEKFQRLWSGNTYGYDSRSEADLALCNLLATYTRGNTEQIDRLFRKSDLMRNKWDELRGQNTYGELTIQKAVDSLGKMSKSFKPCDFSDAGNAQLFADIFKEKAIYTKTQGWLVWDGMCWRADDLYAQKLALQLTDNMWLQAKQEYLAIKKETTESEKLDLAKKFYSHARISRGKARIDGMLALAKSLMFVKPDQLDADPFMLNTPAGMVDLKTGQIHNHDPNKFCTKITQCSPGNKGIEIWDTFIKTVTARNHDSAYFIQQIIGMTAIGKVYEEALVIAHSDGRTGKSTLFNSVGTVLGDYAGTMAADVLTQNHRNKGAELASLKGKRCIIAAELEEGARLSTSMLKQLVSTDKIRGERKYRDPEDFVPSHTVILYTNHLPEIGSTDEGTWRRIIPVHLDSKIDQNKEIKNYADVLVSEAGEAILSWIIEGSKRFIRNGNKIIKPHNIEQAIEKYKSQSDWMEDFLRERAVVSRNVQKMAGELYQGYREFAEKTGAPVRSAKAFKEELTKRNFKCKRTNKGWVWEGISLKDNRQPIIEEYIPIPEGEDDVTY
ncbi:MAG: phage/plasmid primase, P4 family [Christensenellaceae bacterium]|jgi:putative DNA primase/helicase